MNGNNIEPMTERQGKRLLSITNEMLKWAKIANIKRKHPLYGIGDLTRMDYHMNDNKDCIYCIIEYNSNGTQRHLGFNKTLKGAYSDMRDLLLRRYKLWFNSPYRDKFSKPIPDNEFCYIHKQRLGD